MGKPNKEATTPMSSPLASARSQVARLETQQTLDQHTHFRAVEMLFAAAADPVLWPACLEHLSTQLGGAAVLLTVHDEVDRSPFVAAAEIAPELVRAYKDAYWKLDPWATRLAGRPSGTVGFGYEILPQPLLVESAFYHEWMQPQNLAPGPTLSGVLIAGAARSGATLHVFRRRGTRALQPEDVMVLRTLVPHLERAVRIQRERIRLRTEASALRSASERAAGALLLVGADGDILAVTDRAAQVLDQRDGLVNTGGRLGCIQRDDGDRLLALIAQAADSPSASPHETRSESGHTSALSIVARAQGPLRVARPFGQAAWQVHVAHLRRYQGGTNGAAAVLLLADEAHGETTGGQLRERYGFTDTEMRLAALLADGQSLAEAASAQGISLATARAHLRRMLRRTGAPRPADLLRLLTSRPVSRTQPA
jgi:DNA-binding CsgD family transcriptional regulator